MKLVIDTQIKENYGAHTWDGESECPQYWKFKGGYTYVVENVDQYAGICHPYIELLNLIEMKDDYYEEYFLDAYEKEDNEQAGADWEQDWIRYALVISMVSGFAKTPMVAGSLVRLIIK